MNDILLAEQTRAHLEALLVDPPHALLLVGPTGMGKRTVAEAWAAQLTAPAFIGTIQPDEKGTITIETVRGLYRFTRDKRTERQVVVIDNAQTMGIEAQNAFLKLLEEPNTSVSFVLTTPTADALLPTITSRTQSVMVQRIPAGILQKYAQENSQLSAQELTQLLFVADGRPAIITQLLNDPQTFDEHRAIMQQAKKLLTASDYERLSMVTELAKDRPKLIATLEAMGHMLELQLLRDPQPKLAQLADALETCLTRLAQNGNPRAQLTALFSAQ